jgi:hypothetical protein
MSAADETQPTPFIVLLGVHKADPPKAAVLRTPQEIMAVSLRQKWVNNQ